MRLIERMRIDADQAVRAIPFAYFFAVSAILVGFIAMIAQAQAPVPLPDLPDPTSGDFLSGVYEAVTQKNYRLLVAFALVLVVFLVRKGLAGKIPFFATDRGGVALVLLVALATVFAVNLLDQSRALTPQFFLDGLDQTLRAAGGFVVLKRLIWPESKPA